MTFLSDYIFYLIDKIIENNSQDWSDAMRAEGAHIDGPWHKLAFALGCLKCACLTQLRQAYTLKLAGQYLIGLGLSAFCLGGLFMTAILDAPAFQFAILGLLCVYSVAAYLAFTHITRLISFAAYGIFTFISLWAIFMISGFGVAGLSSQLLSALSQEAACIMAVLWVAARYVSMVGSLDIKGRTS